MKFQGKTIVITGASSGIGKAFALKIAKDKCKIILAARRVEKLNELKLQIEQLGSTAEAIATDVSKVEDIRNLFLKATQNGQVIDFVFNNAGLGYVARIQELTADQIKEMVDVNVSGMMLVTKFAAEVMTRQRHGHIIMTSSIGGLIPLPRWSTYVGTKWAITAFAESIRYELSKFNVKVSTLHPGAVDTEFFNKAKSGTGDSLTSEDVANEVYNGAFTNIHKIIIPFPLRIVAWLYRIFPGLTTFFINLYMGELESKQPIPEDEPEFDFIKPLN